jgi:hypothetical protein
MYEVDEHTSSGFQIRCGGGGSHMLHQQIIQIISMWCFEYVPQTDSSHLFNPGNSSAAPILHIAYLGMNNIHSLHDSLTDCKFYGCVWTLKQRRLLLEYIILSLSWCICSFTYMKYLNTKLYIYIYMYNMGTAVALKNTVFWDVTSCSSCKNWCFTGKYHLHHRVTRISELGTLAVTSNWSALVASYC